MRGGCARGKSVCGGKPADHEAGAMVFRHAGGIAAVVSAPHCLLVYRPVRRAPPHHATLGLHLNNIADEQEHISSSGQNIFHVILDRPSNSLQVPAGDPARGADGTMGKNDKRERRDRCGHVPVVGLG